MRMGLIALGIILVIVAALNHFVIKANPVAHTTTIVGAVGAVLLVVGVVMMMMGGSRSAS